MINYNGQVEKPSLIFTRDDKLIAMLPLESKAELLRLRIQVIVRY